MPYTPPSHRSPANSVPTTPDVSRRPSLQPAATRPPLPKSSSYLSKHRRSPSAPNLHESGTSTSSATAGPRDEFTPRPTPEQLQVVIKSDSVRQSPPPVIDSRAMPNGAIMSPPESASENSDEEVDVRGRKLDNVKVKELKDAVSQISHPSRTGSPARDQADHRRELSPPRLSSSQPTLQITLPVDSRDKKSGAGTGPAEPPMGRKVGHVRAVTEPNASLSKAGSAAVTDTSSTSEEDSDTEPLFKPQMIRKRSGELVRPALRPPSRRRPSSMPGTPTFSKAVHFDSHLEHVRHFLQVDRPLAVSASSSPVDNYDSDNEFPFPADKQSAALSARSSPYEWEIITRNFPGETAARLALPVRLERVWLSPTDQKSLIGSIAVANLAFDKTVVCRFTLDYWKTTSEVSAEYSHEMMPRLTAAGHDRFTFSIKLSDMANLEAKTLYFCIRYNVTGSEFWDNNGGVNFQIDFKKKPLTQNSKGGGSLQGAAGRPAASGGGGGLPRSNRRANPGASASGAASALASTARPKPMPVSFDKQNDESGPVGLRFKTKSSSSLPGDNSAKNAATAASAQAFGTRYDFTASLRAATMDVKKPAAPAAVRQDDILYMKPARTAAGPGAVTSSSSSAPRTGESSSAREAPSAPPAGPPVPGTSSPTSLGLGSNSYEELVSRYCFFGSKLPAAGPGHASSPAAAVPVGSPRPAADAAAVVVQHAGPAQHHSSRFGAGRDTGSYFGSFSGSPGSSPVPASPAAAAGSPIKSLVAVAVQHSQAGSPSSPRTTVTLQPSTFGAPIPSRPGSRNSRSVSPASLVGSFQPFMEPSPTEEYSFHSQFQDRFPFSVEDHTATAIRS